MSTEQAPESASDTVTVDDLVHLAEVHLIELEPGDLVLVQAHADLTIDQIDTLRAVVGRCVPGHEVLVLGHELSMHVVRPADDDVVTVQNPIKTVARHIYPETSIRRGP